MPCPVPPDTTTSVPSFGPVRWRYPTRVRAGSGCTARTVPCAVRALRSPSQSRVPMRDRSSMPGVAAATEASSSSLRCDVQIAAAVADWAVHPETSADQRPAHRQTSRARGLMETAPRPVSSSAGCVIGRWRVRPSIARRPSWIADRIEVSARVARSSRSSIPKRCIELRASMSTRLTPPPALRAKSEEGLETVRITRAESVRSRTRDQARSAEASRGSNGSRTTTSPA
ncbi:unannotated protein [freshwater metagenome]|uniref:Unannotated protein n=1 Tax=freshwater metagenome TaxID=449393 RepID=A0A6J6SI06_9ZZZZ